MASGARTPGAVEIGRSADDAGGGHPAIIAASLAKGLD